MQVIILGSGVVGVCSAWYLAEQGHSVTVIDRQSSAALETSYANAGQISPGYSAPWAAPGVPLKAIRWLLDELGPLRVSAKSLCTPDLQKWLIKLLLQCNHKSYAVNKAKMLQIATYSRECYETLRQTHQFEYDQSSKGTLQLFRSDKQVKASQADIKILEDCGVDHQSLNLNECINYEPALQHVADKFVGGLRLPNDETGDCFKFTQLLAQACKDKGVRFLFDTTIDKIATEKGLVKGIEANGEVYTADQYVLALGAHSPLLAKTLGIKLPIYPVKGYSITLDIINEELAPRSTIMDETHKVAITRLGNRIRVGGTAELSGYNLKTPESRKRNLEHVINDLFGGAATESGSEFWAGLRPMTPSGVPIIGKSEIGNLYLNTGHGTLGWTMGAGSGKLLSDLMSGIQPKVGVLNYQSPY
ncbi:MAG: D-amino-acid dehydrogenase [Saprospiraceae bacterium]|jgi:D-amino-acid dehydrogenase